MGDEMVHVSIESEPLDLNKCVRIVSDDRAGAISTFVGVTRNTFEGKRVEKLEYECYEPMAVEKLESMCKKILAYYNDKAKEENAIGIVKICIKHRVGTVLVGEPSVMIAVSSVHREASLKAVQWAIDELKRSVPIWKKEFFENGEFWKENAEQRLRPRTKADDGEDVRRIR